MPEPIARIEREHDAQERVWRASRATWVAVALLLAAAAAGLFGDGPLARAEAEAPDGSLRASYGRFQREGAPTVFWLRPSPDAVASGEARLCADRAFLEAWRVVAFEPEPEAQEARGREVCYAFRLSPAPPADEAGPPGIAMRAVPRGTAFPARGTLRLDGRAPLALSALVWP